MLLLELAVEPLGDALDVQRLAESSGDLDDAERCPRRRARSKSKTIWPSLLRNRSPGWPLTYRWSRANCLPSCRLTQYQRLWVRVGIDEDQQILVELLGDFLVDGGAGLASGIGRRDGSLPERPRRASSAMWRRVNADSLTVSVTSCR